METTKLKLLTIIAEDELERRLVADLRSEGVTGYTVEEARGSGARRTRDDAWEGENIRIEILADEPTARRVAERIAGAYFEAFGVVVFLSDVEVLRPEKFSRPGGAGPGGAR
jgi:nitrogen regulatory protein P-II 2